MQNILDVIQTIARSRGRSDNSPLILLRSLDGSSGQRATHVPIDNELAQAWLALLGEPFRPHQAQAVTAARRGEPVALLASNPRVSTTAYMLLYALLGEPQTSALVLAPDARAVHTAHARLNYINDHLPLAYHLTSHVVEPHVRPDPYARVVIATPDNLHTRLLRYHDRAWNIFWPHVRMLSLLDVHYYHGVAAAHLSDLLLRAQRIAALHGGATIPHLVASGWEINEPLPALESLYHAPWKVISGDDLPYAPTALAVWRGNNERFRESVEIARAIQKQGYHVHVLCQPMEEAALTPLLGDAEEITYGTVARAAHVLICTGYPGSQSHLRRLLRSGYQLVVVVLGDAPHEHMLARHTETMLSQTASAWPAAPLNVYVTAQQLLCAAFETPLTESEVENNNLGEIVDRLIRNNQLLDLPDPEVAWQPGPAAADPYAEFSMLSASGNAALAQNEQGQNIELLDPSSFERWCYLNAALPPLRGGLRVSSFEADTTTFGIRLETNQRRTIPLRRCTISPREEREQRTLFISNAIGYGRTLVEEEIYSSREATPHSAPAEVHLRPPLNTRWIAPCCWIELPTPPQSTQQTLGWSLAAALEFHTLGTMQDIVPCYVPEKRRLYLVDAQPGGNGLAAWLYANAEELLPTAYDIALACRNDPLFEPFARADMAWLLPLLGRRAETPALPNSESPKMVLLPAPEPAEVPTGEPKQQTQHELPSSQETPKDRHEASGKKRTSPADQARPAEDRIKTTGKSESLFRQRGKPAEKRNMPANQPTAREQQAAQPAPTELAPDANALIERLRRQREQRELERGRATNAPSQPSNTANMVLRFRTGDKVFCLPYGDGIVRESRAEDDREILSVAFPDYGELTIDPAIALVRKIEDAQEEDELL